MADYTRAIELEQANGLYYFNRATAYYEQDDLLAAVQDVVRMEQVDPDFAKEQRDTFYRRNLKVKNAFTQPMRVYLKFHAWNDDDTWEWRPSPPGDDNWAQYIFQPGEEAYVSFQGERVAADRVRIWAETTDERYLVAQYRDTDDVIVPDEGYESYFMGFYQHTFDIANPPQPIPGTRMPGPSARIGD